MHAEPQKEHAWLEQLVGDWTSECEATAMPDQPPTVLKGIERVRPVGGLWTVGEGETDMPDGGCGRTVMTLGYDPTRKAYVGSFIGSMMPFLWTYTGQLDAAGRVLTLDAEGPGMAGDGKMAKYRDAIELVSKDHRILTSRFLGSDGQWHLFMTAHYRRTA